MGKNNDIDKIKNHLLVLNEIAEARIRIGIAMDITNCGFCQRDLMICDLILTNIEMTLAELMGNMQGNEKITGEDELLSYPQDVWMPD